jgi:hypothetical protein
MMINASGFDPSFSGGDGFPGDDGMFTVLPVLFVIAVLAIVGVAVYRSVRMAKRGQNPFTIEEDLVHSATKSRILAPTATLEQRLAELDDLHRRGVISDEEHRAARADALRA